MIKEKALKNTTIKQRLVKRIERSYLIRFHMFLILSATILSGAVFSKLLLLLGVSRMSVRYGIVATLSYLLFFLFVKLWLLYIGIGRSAVPTKDEKGSNSDWIDLVASPLDFASSFGEHSSFTGFGSGASGGAGASSSFIDSNASVETAMSVQANSAMSNGRGGHGSAIGDMLDIGDIDIKLIAIILLAVLVLSIFMVGIYLIWCAPTILADAAFEVLLVTGLAGKVRQAEQMGWEITIFKATWWMFLIILIVSVAFGIAAQKAIPTAVTVRDLVKVIN